MSESEGPRVARYVGPLLDVLRDLDGSAKSREATEAVVVRVGLTDAEQAVMNESGQTQAYNDIAWARFYLAKAGLIDSSRRGVWTSTEEGRKIDLDTNAALRLTRGVRRGKQRKDAIPGPDLAPISSPEDEDLPNDAGEEETEAEIGFNDRMLAVLRSLSPNGFERVCRRLLLEAGFEEVKLTPPGPDGGIDGTGLLPINPFVTLTTAFQCKRYTNAVSAPQVRDFRDASSGRADRRLILTSGRFTPEAAREARRDGVPSVELIDGPQLVQLFRSSELGLKPRIVYDIDEAFFAEFRE